MYKRTTTASRRAEQRLRDRIVHISQAHKPVAVKDDLGVTMRIDYVPMFTRTVHVGKDKTIEVAHGKTYNTGANAIRRLCKTLGLSRTQYLRDPMGVLGGAIG